MQRKIAYQPSQDEITDRPIIDVTPEPVDEVKPEGRVDMRGSKAGDGDRRRRSMK